jgi:hypothetical protein
MVDIYLINQVLYKYIPALIDCFINGYIFLIELFKCASVLMLYAWRDLI